jgi:quercetin dioxygenase-like cupin family protein
VNAQARSDPFVESLAVAWEQAGPGVRRQVLGHDPALMLVSVRFEQGSVGPVHWHPHRQVSFVVAGRFEVRIGDEIRVLSAGDCFIVPPDVPHGAVALEDGALVDVFAPAREDFLPAPAGLPAGR